MEKVLGGAVCHLALGLGVSLTVTITGRLGECVRGGGDEIGESWVVAGGVLPLKGLLRPLGWSSCDCNLRVIRENGGLSPRFSGEELL